MWERYIYKSYMVTLKKLYMLESENILEYFTRVLVLYN